MRPQDKSKESNLTTKGVNDMGIFGKKKGSEFEGLHNDNLFNDDDDIIMPNGQKRSNSHSVGHSNTFAPHALTADELSFGRSTDTTATKPRANSVYERMKEREQAETDNSFDDNYIPSWATTKEKCEEKAQAKPEVVSQGAVVEAKNEVKAVSEPKKVVGTIEPSHSPSADAFLERCRIAVEKASSIDDRIIAPETEVIPANEPKEEPKQEAKAKPTSVDEMVEMLRGSSAVKTDAKPDTIISEQPSSADKGDIKVDVEVIPTDSDPSIMQTTLNRKAGDGDVRIYGKVVRGAVLGHTADGEDVKVDELIKNEKVTQDTIIADTIIADDKTIMFGNLDDIISKRADDDFNAASAEFDEDLYDDDDDDYLDAPYYETEDPALSDIDDYKNLNDAARLRTKYMAEKSKDKIVSVFTAIAVLIMLILATPLVKLFNLPANTVSTMEVILLGACLAVNIDLFGDFKNLFKFRPKFDSCAMVVTSVTFIQSVVSVFVYDNKYSGLALAAALILTCCRFARLMKASRILKGLELIANSEEKRSVVSVGGNNAKTIASSAVEGEALVLCDRKAINIRDFIKNSSYDSPFERKTKALFIITTVISIIAGVVAGYFGGFGLGITVVSALMCCMLPACAAFICELPMYLAHKKALRYGAMIAGYKGAYDLNLANLVAVSSSDLFPEGSVSLYNMKTLAENEIGKTLVDAGAVAIAANSPLSGIFREIVGNDNCFPKVNGVQYEDKMGISGWIGERTILIGNRNLMQGHNINVPPASVDQKILRAGYFPVYIAVDGVPCLLFIVKYTTDPSVAHELQRLCNTGMTVVVDPKDPNTSEAMICDYFGLPNDALRVMNHNGRVSYERAASAVESASAPAVFGKNICGFFSTVSSSIRLSGIYTILTVLFVISSVLATAILAYLCLTAKLSLLTSLTFAGFQLLFIGISVLVAKVRSLK